MARKDTVAADDYRAEVAGLKATMPELEAAEREAGAALEAELAAIPNLPLDDTPDGKDENDNVEVRRYGSRRAFPKGSSPRSISRSARRWASWISTPRRSCPAPASSSSRARWRGSSRALEQFMLDLHTSEHGYQEVEPPVLVRDAAMFGTAQLPKFEEDQFRPAV